MCKAQQKHLENAPPQCEWSLKTHRKKSATDMKLKFNQDVTGNEKIEHKSIKMHVKHRRKVVQKRTVQVGMGTY